jgi:N6-L-threonylcarbamoyladenine synthase
MAAEEGVELYLSPRDYCTDNAAMAAVAWELLDAGRVAPLDLDVTPGLIRRSSG